MSIKNYNIIVNKMSSEGPECRMFVELLNRTLKGKNVKEWVFSGGKYTDSFPKGYDEFDKNLPMTVNEVSCKGNFIYFTLTNKDDIEYYILNQIIMSGVWTKNHDKSCKWFLELDNDKTVWFRDIDDLSTLEFTKNKKTLTNKLNSFGPDIMRDNFHLKDFKKKIVKFSNKNITSFLMDKSIISGCGNHIKCEALYYASVSPLRKSGTLNVREIELIYEGLRIISRLCYNNGDKKTLQIYKKKLANVTKTPDGRLTYWNKKKQK
jgi:formamidopyrimidine-DNA glycosylase